jgi:thiosulfate dehydrogenase [quinone] large subunit
MHAMESGRMTAGTWPQGLVRAQDKNTAATVDQKEALATPALDRPARWGMALVFLLLGYEWLISGLDKMLSSDFLTGLGAELQDAMANNPNGWYVHFLARFVIPHARLAAALVEGGEVLVATGLFVGAGLWISGDRLSPRWARTLQPWVIGALVGSALMTVNYYFMAGNSFPWLRPSAPFDEGLELDGLLTLVAVALLGIQLLAMRATMISARNRANHPVEIVRP